MKDRHLSPIIPHFVPLEDLSNLQLDRQTVVDEMIYDAVNRLIPPQYCEMRQQFEWNIEWIAEIREVIQEVIFDKLGLIENITDEDERSARLEQFEMNFYPFLATEEE